MIHQPICPSCHSPRCFYCEGARKAACQDARRKTQTSVNCDRWPCHVNAALASPIYFTFFSLLSFSLLPPCPSRTPPCRVPVLNFACATQTRRRCQEAGLVCFLLFARRQSRQIVPGGHRAPESSISDECFITGSEIGRIVAGALPHRGGRTPWESEASSSPPSASS